MFTGIIKSIGKVVKPGPALAVRTPFKKVRKGDSVSVEGVCLTAVAVSRRKGGTDLQFQVSEETLDKSTLGGLKAGSSVNLELPLKAGEALGGHFVQGHVDGTGKIVSIGAKENSSVYTFSCPPELKPYLVPKGSVAVDGISLTIAAVQGRHSRPPRRVNPSGNLSFSVSVLPFTQKATSLKLKKKGDPVNLEADILAKVVAQSVSLYHT